MGTGGSGYFTRSSPCRLQDPRHRRPRDPNKGRDPGARHPVPPKLDDQLLPVPRNGAGHSPRPRRPIREPDLGGVSEDAEKRLRRLRSLWSLFGFSTLMSLNRM